MATLTSSILTTNASVLAYALPNLLASLVVVFAATYLSLDKTRSFPPLNDPADSVVLDIPGSYSEVRGSGTPLDQAWDPEKPREALRVPRANPRFSQMLRSKSRARIWRLEGGVGGALTGSMFGVFLSTLLTLYIVEHSTRKLSRIPFLIITFLSNAVFSCLAARFHAVTLVLGTIGGSFSIATFAAFAVSISPIARLSILAALTMMLSIFPVISFIAPHKVYISLHWSMRLAQSALGSMGVVYSIAVLAHVPGWEDALDAVWVETRSDSAATLALSIAGWLLFILGVGCDWILYRSLGPSQDQNWDSYLAHYLDNLPNRAGHYERLPSIWSRVSSVFHRSHHPVSSSFDEESLPSTIGQIPPSPKKRKPLKALPTVHFDLASTSSDSEPETQGPFTSKAMEHGKPIPDSSDGASELTLLGPGRVTPPKLKTKDDDEWTIEKYEGEADITHSLLPPDERLTAWKPAFMKKAHDTKSDDP